jgi:DNA-binding MarR family transcriptional regulator
MSKGARRPGEPAAGQQSVLQLILDVAHQLDQRLEAALARRGLSGAKACALSSLAEAEQPLTLSELAEESSCVRSNITQLMDRLESDGLVRRVNDPDDRRIRRAALTSEGRKICKEAARVMAEQEQALAEILTPAEAASLARVLRRIADGGNV